MTNQIRFLIDCLIEQMALMLMNDYNMSITDALDTVFKKIEDLETELYYQSAKYNYELLRHEMKYGKLV